MKSDQKNQINYLDMSIINKWYTKEFSSNLILNFWFNNAHYDTNNVN